jgi:hypothetical protein
MLLAALTKEQGHKPTVGSPSRWEVRPGAACLYMSLSTKSGSQKPMNSGRVEVASAITEPAATVWIDVLLGRIPYQHSTRR